MIIAVLATDGQKEEMTASAFFRSHELLFSENISLWSNHIADAFVDLRFESSPERIGMLAKLLPKSVMVSAVTDTISQIHPEFIRINGWPGFLKGNYLEAAAHEERRVKAEELFGKSLLFVKDVPGFVSARIVAMIINEAYFTFESGTASKEDIDIAMKLGTRYPFGPFEWGEKIGVERVVGLLRRLTIESPIYEVADSLNNAVNR